eukprot:12266547-Prorocentrum_lima.AAC.1
MAELCSQRQQLRSWRSSGSPTDPRTDGEMTPFEVMLRLEADGFTWEVRMPRAARTALQPYAPGRPK